jgi:hypothetical protein
MRDRDPNLDAAKKLAADLQQANFHNGPWYLQSSIRISDASFSEGGYLPAGDTSGGISFTVEAPQRLYFVPRKKVIFSVEAIPGYSFFHEGKASNQFNYLLRGDAHFLLNHLYLDAYGVTSDRIEAHVADLNRLATAREKTFGLAGEVKYSSRTSALFNVSQRRTDYPSNRFQPDPEPGIEIPVRVLDRRENNARLSLLHKTFPRTSLFVAGELSKYEFPNKESYESQRTYAGAGFAYDGGRTQMRAEAGPVRLRFKDPSQPDYKGVSAQLRASRGAGRWTVSAGADRDIGFSIFRDNPYFISTGGQIGLDYQATRKLSLNAKSAYAQYDYDIEVEGQKRRDNVSFSSLGFTYGIRRVRFGADVGWYERDTTAFGDVDSGIRYVLRLSLVP